MHTLAAAVVLRKSRASGRSLGVSLDVDSHVGDEVGRVELGDEPIALCADSIEAVHDGAVQVEGGILSEGGLEECRVVSVESYDTAIDGIRDGLAAT